MLETPNLSLAQRKKEEMCRGVEMEDKEKGRNEKIVIVYTCSVTFKIFGQRLKTLTIRFINIQKIERK